MKHHAGICGQCGASLGGDRTWLGRNITGKSRTLVMVWLFVHRWFLCPPMVIPPGGEL